MLLIHFSSFFVSPFTCCMFLSVFSLLFFFPLFLLYYTLLVSFFLSLSFLLSRSFCLSLRFTPFHFLYSLFPVSYLSFVLSSTLTFHLRTSLATFLKRFQDRSCGTTLARVPGPVLWNPSVKVPGQKQWNPLAKVSELE